MIVFHEELCVMCGAVIPEGQMVCPICIQAVEEKALPIPAVRQSTAARQNTAPDYHPDK